MREKTLLAYRVPQSHTFSHWLHEFWPQTVMAWLLASVFTLVAFGILFGSASPADAFLVAFATLALLLFQLAGAAVWYHYFGGTISVTLTSHGLHILHENRFGRKAHFAPWQKIHSVRFRHGHHTAVVVRKKRIFSDHLLLTAPEKHYKQLVRVLTHHVKRVI